MKYLLAFVMACSLACSGASPIAPPAGFAGSSSSLTVHQAPRALAYAINIPDVATTLALRRSYPDGVQTAPLTAQARWDYTRAYGGTPNVYAGEVSPPCPVYVRVGIVIAPRTVASMDTFTSANWPGIGLDAGVTYVWTGQFVYAAVAPVGSYEACH